MSALLTQLSRLPYRDPYVGRWGGGRGEALAPGESQRRIRAAEAPAGQREGERRGTSQGHS